MSSWVSAALLVVPFLGVSDLAPKPLNPQGPLGIAIESFGGDLSRTLLAAPKNRVFSPFSITVAFAMAREGADGETAKEIERVLHLEALSAPGALASAVGGMSGTIASGGSEESKKPRRDEPKVSLANGIWVQEDFSIEATYVRTLESRYRARARSIDFSDTSDARDEINDWVEESTSGRIEELLGEDLPTSDTVVMLVNAIHFQALWLHDFHEASTARAPFTIAPEHRVEVEMMSLVERLRYAESEHAQRVALPYRGGEFEMVVIVPKVGMSIAELTDLERSASGAGLKEIEVRLKLPKFEFGETFDLMGPLRELGLNRSFEAGKAEFTRMSKAGPLYIGAAVHGARIRIDEFGTEAAAATAVAMLKGLPGVGPNVVEMTADRPFLFHIRHPRSRAVLFSGRVQDPTRSSH